jgi:hypothetical protein
VLFDVELGEFLVEIFTVIPSDSSRTLRPPNVRVSPRLRLTASAYAEATADKSARKLRRLMIAPTAVGCKRLFGGHPEKDRRTDAGATL